MSILVDEKTSKFFALLVYQTDHGTQIFASTTALLGITYDVAVKTRQVVNLFINRY